MFNYNVRLFFLKLILHGGVKMKLTFTLITLSLLSGVSPLKAGGDFDPLTALDGEMTERHSHLLKQSKASKSEKEIKLINSQLETLLEVYLGRKAHDDFKTMIAASNYEEARKERKNFYTSDPS